MSIRQADLSVITIVLNDEQGLKGTINSVQSQKALTIEHLIVDGGSTDGSALIAKQNSDVVISSEADGGIYPAMQRGALCASGEYIVFCNSGDVIYGDLYLANAIDQLKKEGSPWGFGPIIEKTERNTYTWVPASTISDSNSIISRETFVPFPSFIIKRDLFNKLGGLTSIYKIAGDFELICKASLISKPTIFEEPIALFSAGGVSYINADLAWREEIAIRKNLLKLHSKAIFLEWIKYCVRVCKWRIGKLIDTAQKLFFNGRVSWRDLRAIEVPDRFSSFLPK